ncbi:MAG: tetratricopeptide repeat protein [Leptolyngbyaceae cyanobacterium SM2_3_12]|nr:tetratricopeptide repeat protein [Leptolyngbyaceae cyanobacterium SM2_3_12]
MAFEYSSGLNPCPEAAFANSGGEAFQDWYDRGEALANAGDYARALRCFEEASIISSLDPEALLYQAVCLIHLDQPQKALAITDRLLSLAPNHPQGWLFRGVVLHRLGHYRAAYTSYDQAQVYGS